MKRYGFIREKNDIKFLILYCMRLLEEPVTLAQLADIVLCDEPFGYFEFADALFELVDSRHIISEERPTEDVYSITQRGRDTAEAFEKSLPSPVREAARRSTTRVVRALRRDAAIQTELVTRKDKTRAVRMAFLDEDVPVFGFEIMVQNDEQGEQFARNFRAHAERIYSGILSVLLNDYSEPDEFERSLMELEARRKAQKPPAQGASDAPGAAGEAPEDT